MAAAPTDGHTVVLIHGMWMTPLGWEHWAERYRERGHRPGRAAPARPRPRAAGVALGTAAPKGVLRLPLSTLRAGWPALKNPAGKNDDVPLTKEQFHWCFTNSLGREDSDAAYERYYVPGSARPFFQAGYANVNPRAVTKVDFRNPSRPPLLLATGTEDRICPPSVNVSNWKKQRRAHSATEHRESSGRCHFPGQEGWERVADDALGWATASAAA